MSHDNCPTCGSQLGSLRKNEALRRCNACQRPNPRGFQYCGFCAAPLENTELRAHIARVAAPPGGWPSLARELLEVRFFLDRGDLGEAFEMVQLLRQRWPGHPALEEFQGLTPKSRPKRIHTGVNEVVDAVLADSADWAGRAPRRAAPRWKAPPPDADDADTVRHTSDPSVPLVDIVRKKVEPEEPRERDTMRGYKAVSSVPVVPVLNPAYRDTGPQPVPSVSATSKAAAKPNVTAPVPHVPVTPREVEPAAATPTTTATMKPATTGPASRVPAKPATESATTTPASASAKGTATIKPAVRIAPPPAVGSARATGATRIEPAPRPGAPVVADGSKPKPARNDDTAVFTRAPRPGQQPVKPARPATEPQLVPPRSPAGLALPEPSADELFAEPASRSSSRAPEPQPEPERSEPPLVAASGSLVTSDEVDAKPKVTRDTRAFAEPEPGDRTVVGPAPTRGPEWVPPRGLTMAVDALQPARPFESEEETVDIEEPDASTSMRASRSGVRKKKGKGRKQAAAPASTEPESEERRAAKARRRAAKFGQNIVGR